MAGFGVDDKKGGKMKIQIVISLIMLSSSLSVTVADTDKMTPAIELIRKNQAPGGICLVIGDKNSKLTDVLGKEERFVVQSLYSQPKQVEKARKTILNANLYGRVSATQFNGQTLPYTDNLINFVLAGESCKISFDEILRVLTPLGTAFVYKSLPGLELAATKHSENAPAASNSDYQVSSISDSLLKITKAWPKEIDEWSHFLHAADGNPVAQDTKVGPPTHTQWIAGPTWAQSHETDTSLR
jgi:hypothetical protein